MNLLQRFLRKGTENVTDPFDARRILLLNLFSCVGVFTLAAAVAQSLASHEPKEMAVVLAVATVLMFGVPFAGRKNPNLGTVYILVLANLLILFFANAQGLGAGTYFYYFPLFFANAWLMDFRKPWNALLLVSMTLVSIAGVLLMPHSLFGLSISEEVQKDSFVFNLSAAAFIMALNTIVIVWMNYRRQQEIESRISETEKIAEQLKVALKEKVVLLAEIHHRVKNNLAVVRGLLNMQMNTTTNENARFTLRESVSRVTAMALIHQKLYANINPDKIDLKSYVTELVREIAYTFKSNSHTEPRVEISISDVSVHLDNAVPCGLILNELLTNAYKHAFPEETEPCISITITADSHSQDHIRLVIEDNGTGLPPAPAEKDAETLGMTLIQSLTEQLDGEFTMGPGEKKGTRAVLVFPNKVN